MRIVVDTNILISGIFFGGFPEKIINAVVKGELEAYISSSILEEYKEITESFKNNKAGHFNSVLYATFLGILKVVEPSQSVHICRDPDDDKFIECALSAKAFYIVGGDKDLLVLKRYKDIEIITAKAFCERFLFDKKIRQGGESE